jgi:hypothetical protein
MMLHSSGSMSGLSGYAASVFAIISGTAPLPNGWRPVSIS